ncbi:unnamed protein product [Caenorhabditis sp. 36 PRJEB53466]|nr:unnamed protein product [Caenorhabditis sp. 36 PRJEB53466]
MGTTFKTAKESLNITNKVCITILLRTFEADNQRISITQATSRITVDKKMYGKMVNKLFVEGLKNSDRAEPKDALRAVLLILLFAFTFGAGMLATFLQGEWANSHILSFFSCIGGGVFLGACLLDLLPDSIETFENAKITTSFPIPFFCFALGFLLVLSVDQLVKTIRDRSSFGAIGYHVHSHGEVNTTGENSEHHEEDSGQSGFRVSMLVCALSIHALFEGLSLAVTTDPSQLLQIFGALAIHKCIMGFCLGVRLIQSRLVQVLIGGITGIGLMRFISRGDETLAAAVSSVLQAIACGTFLYITTFEVIPHELHGGKYRILKMIFICAGFGLVVAFILVFPDAI